MPCVVFEAANSLVERPQTFVLDRMTTGISKYIIYYIHEYIYTCIFKLHFHLPAYCITGRFNQKGTMNCASHSFALSCLGGSLSVGLRGFLYSEEEGKHFDIKVDVYLPDCKA